METINARTGQKNVFTSIGRHPVRGGRFYRPGVDEDPMVRMSINRIQQKTQLPPNRLQRPEIKLVEHIPQNQKMKNVIIGSWDKSAGKRISTGVGVVVPVRPVDTRNAYYRDFKAGEAVPWDK